MREKSFNETNNRKNAASDRMRHISKKLRSNRAELFDALNVAKQQARLARLHLQLCTTIYVTSFLFPMTAAQKRRGENMRPPVKVRLLYAGA